MNNNISDKDKKDWANFLSREDKLPDKDLVFNKEKNFKKKLCDLHGYSLDEANAKVKELIKDAYENSINKLIIITGKGIHSKNEKDPYVSKDLGILKYSIPEYINNDKDLMDLIKEIKDAGLKDGGSGAFYIYLKKKIIK